MSKSKIMRKERVLSQGNSYRRAVLCYDSGLVYNYHDPSDVFAYYESGKGWITLDQKRYSTGGWGSGSSGDPVSYYSQEHTRALLRSIGATVFEVNLFNFLTEDEILVLNKTAESHNKLVKKIEGMANGMGEFYPAETIKPVRLTRISKANRSLKGIDPFDTLDKLEAAVKVFIDQKGKTIKVDGYTVSKNKITFHSPKNKYGVSARTVTIAVRDDKGQVILNSQQLECSPFERAFLGGQSVLQKTVREMAKYAIPFNVLEAAKLKLEETKVIEQGPESTHGSRHFTGALLLENAGRKFLMDIDRVEIEHGIFNAFFVELGKQVNTIAEGYESMKPDEVRKAEAEGTEVLRQGEWFFINTGETIEVDRDDVLRWEPEGEEDRPKKYVLERAVAHGKGRPNNLYKPFGFGKLDELVCGTVSHQGREHKDLDLGEWRKTKGKKEVVTYALWKLVGNTTVGNFTITGDVD